MKKLMICIDLTDYSLDVFRKALKDWDWGAYSEVHFVHAFRKKVFADNFYFTTFPHKEEEMDIMKSVEDVLANSASQIIPKDHNLKRVYKCLMTLAPKEEIKDYAKKNGIDMMLIGTKEKNGIEGFFASSFAEYMVSHAHCALTIVRQQP